MKRNFYSALLLAAAGLQLQPAEAKIIHLLPRPQQITADTGQPFALQRAVALTDPTGCQLLRGFLEQYGCTVDENAAARITVELVDDIEGNFDYRLDGFPAEGYTLAIDANSVSIRALNATGVIRAVQTLAQLAEGYDEGAAALEALTMTDFPAFKLRGYMHDVGRSFLSFDELKKQIDLLARFKVNVFHWHLTEKLAWRFEVKAYPQLTAAENMIRYPGQYYTQEQCRELEAYAAERGVTVIPEIDMPGHSDVFTQAMGFSMQTDEGVAALKVILNEVLETFPLAPYIHIGGDEVRITYPNFLETMAQHVRAQGRKVVVWNKLVAGAPTAAVADMTQMWATSGVKVAGLPNIDCRYNYTNHFDLYADLVGIYKSNIYYEQRGNPDVAGTISAAWNDTKTASETDIIRQNNIYANVLASAERAWCGGGEEYIEKGGTTLPNSGPVYEEFADFERRFLFHKAHSLRNEPIAYVKQSNVHWRITSPFPNGGDAARVLPPEQADADILPDAYEYEGQTYTSSLATGAGIYLRHIWHPTVPSYFSNPANGQTAYAWTYVYSPVEQEVGAQIEFYTYSRSGSERAPEAGKWDRRGSRIWFNGQEIAAPEWTQPNISIPQDHATIGLTNENVTARPVVPLTLKQGWNKVFMKLPHANNGGTGRDKWQFTFVITDREGRDAIEGLIYSPSKCLDEEADQVAACIDEINNYVRANFNELPGYYPVALAADIKAKISEVQATLSEPLTAEERALQKEELNAALAALRAAAETAEINQPAESNGAEEHWYTFCTPQRGNRYPTSKGAGAEIIGETATGKSATWKFVKRTDGDYDIINAADGSYVSPASANNTALRTSATAPTAGWRLSKADEAGYAIIVSGTAQFNQTNNAGLGFKVYNWGGGSNTTDAGCKYRFAVVDLPAEPKASNDEYSYWYQFCTPLRGNRYPTSKGTGQAIVGEQSASEAATWKFVKRTDGSLNIINRSDATYISPASDNNTALRTVSEEPATGWEFKPAATDGYFIITSGTVQFNQTNNAGQGFNVYNWGDGSNTTDTGCQYLFTLVDTEHVSSGIASATPDGNGESFRVENGRIIGAKGLRIFSADGRELPAGQRLTPGVYMVRNGAVCRKVVVR